MNKSAAIAFFVFIIAVCLFATWQVLDPQWTPERISAAMPFMILIGIGVGVAIAGNTR